MTRWTFPAGSETVAGMPSPKIVVGSDIVYQCSRCQLDLAHTVIAMVRGEPARIRCNTCKSERNFRQKKHVESVLRPTQIRPKISGSDLYQKLLSESNMKNPKTYRADQPFEMKDVINHPKFGKGIVIRIQPPDRMEVLFPDESRILVCALGATSS